MKKVLFNHSSVACLFRLIRHTSLVIVVLSIMGVFQSCSIIKTVIVYPESIMDFYDCIIEKDTARFKYFVKYYKDIDNFFVMKTM